MSGSIMDRWGKRLAEKRQELGLSEMDLAGRWKLITKSREAELASLVRAIRRYESGKTRRPRGEDDIAELAEALGVDPFWLETGIESEQPALLDLVEAYLRARKVPKQLAEVMRRLPYETMGIRPHRYRNLDKLYDHLDLLKSALAHTMWSARQTEDGGDSE
jgi:transcriptional regulator with XRE-family HTH domain